MPTYQCVAYGCRPKDKPIHGEKRAYHRFPLDEKLREIWIKAVCVKNWKPKYSSKICSNHFTPDCYTQSKKKTLKRDAIPTVFSNYPRYLHKDLSKLAVGRKLEQSKKRIISQRNLLLAIDSFQNSVVDCSTEAPIYSVSQNANSSYVSPREMKLQRIIVNLKEKASNRLNILRATEQRSKNLRKKILSLKNALCRLRKSI